MYYRCDGNKDLFIDGSYHSGYNITCEGFNKWDVDAMCKGEFTCCYMHTVYNSEEFNNDAKAKRHNYYIKDKMLELQVLQE